MNVFDEALAEAPAQSQGDVWDQALTSKGDIWDQVLTEPASPTPETDKALASTKEQAVLSRAKAFVEGAGIPTSVEGLKEFGKFLIRSPIQDVKDIYQGVTEIPGKISNFGKTISESPIAKVYHDPLSPESFGTYGTAVGMTLGPKVIEAVKSVPGKFIAEKGKPATTPPVAEQTQPTAPTGAGEAIVEPTTTGEPVYAEGIPQNEASNAEGVRESQGPESSSSNVEQAPQGGQDGGARSQVADAELGTPIEPLISPETGQPIPRHTIGTADAIAEIERRNAPEPQPTEPVGGNVEGFEKVYGEGEIPAGESITPEEAFDRAQARQASGVAKPYSFIDRARSGAITPTEMGDLVAEHHRLITEAAAKEGTSEYGPAYEAARTFAQNVLKPAENAWHQKGMVMQIKAPIDYTNLTGLKQVMEKRMGREMMPEEEPAFAKVAQDIKGVDQEASVATSNAINRVRKHFGKTKDIAFEDAAKQIHESIGKLTKDCIL